MMRTLRTAVMVLGGVMGAGLAFGARAPQTVEAGPAAWVLVDADSGTVLTEQDAHRSWPPASMTKMMTVLLAMERVRSGAAKLTDPVRASAWASRIGGSQVYLAEGETFSLGELLEAVMIASANDGAVAVAEHLAGSSPAFVDLMNERARSLGLTETVYRSPHGLPPAKGQEPDLTSAGDLAVLARELMRYPEVMKWAGAGEASFRGGSLEMRNTNHLVRTFSGATGLKTGYYVAAGFSVTATARRGDLSLIAVVLGLPTKQGCFREASRILNEGFAGYRVIAAAQRAKAAAQVAVSGGEVARVAAIADRDLRLVVRRAEEKGVEVEAQVPSEVAAPVHRGQPLGVIVLRRGETELGRVAVRAERDVAATGWFAWLWNRGLTTAARP